MLSEPDQFQTEQIRERIDSTPTVLAYFSHESCSVCTALLPKVRELLDEYPQVTFQYIDTALHPSISGQHLVFAAPTIIIFHEGREIKRFGRNVSLSDLQVFLDQIA